METHRDGAVPLKQYRPRLRAAGGSWEAAWAMALRGSGGDLADPISPTKSPVAKDPSVGGRDLTSHPAIMGFGDSPAGRAAAFASLA